MGNRARPIVSHLTRAQVIMYTRGRGRRYSSLLRGLRHREADDPRGRPQAEIAKTSLLLYGHCIIAREFGFSLLLK